MCYYPLSPEICCVNADILRLLIVRARAHVCVFVHVWQFFVRFGFWTRLQKLSGMEYEVKRRGFRSNAERRVIQHPEWGGLMKLLRQTAENTAGLSIKHPKLVSALACCFWV